MTSITDGLAELLESPLCGTTHAMVLDRLYEEFIEGGPDPHAECLRLVLAHRDNDGPRLLYAMSCEQRGESERAEFVRVQCELARGPDARDCSAMVSTEAFADLRGRNRMGAIFNAGQLAPDDVPPIGSRAAVRKLCTQGEHNGKWWYVAGVVAEHFHADGKFALSITPDEEAMHSPVHFWGDELRRRERELLHANHPLNNHVWTGEPLNDYNLMPHTTRTFRRGFVDTITGPAFEWLAHGDTICSQHPVSRVRLTSRPTVGMAGCENIPGVFEKWLAAKWPGITFGLPAISGTGARLTVGGVTVPVRSWTINPPS